MSLGTKIRKIRELKGYSQENMAHALEMSQAGYGKIERDEVNITYDKLMKIAEVLETQIENIINFDEKTVITNFNPKIHQQIGSYYYSSEMKELYQAQIKLLEEKVKFLEDKIKQLTLN
ncbi:MAG: helix-turn-helix transcriptional regulator [Saprospiraceae bacterium]|jgi:transcriptional regulator with XRE-family HTH domain|nr:helix-turn-helix transcriptional regulator [Candidatus Defluviibacterium haderslevense]MBK8243307.1 helix-turn-helix transcriptional regulator [Candidatus Defluviibacterium haderslevense]